MVHSSCGIDVEAGSGVGGDNVGFSGDPLLDEGLARKTLNLCISLVVASQTLSKRNGLEAVMTKGA